MVTEIEDARKVNFVLLEGIGNTKIEQFKPVITGGVHPEFEVLLKNDTKLKDLYEGNWQKYGFKSRSEAEESLVTLLCMKGLTDGEIKDVMQGCKIGKWQEKEDSYLDLTIKKGREFTEVHKREFETKGSDDEKRLEIENNEAVEGVEGVKGVKGATDIERITIDFLLFPTAHLPNYDDLNSLIGLIGKEYTPIKKAIYYHCLSWKYRKSVIHVGKINTDARIHVMLRQMTGTGKQNIIDAISRLSEKYGLKYGAPTSLHPEQLIGKTITSGKGQRKEYKEIDGYFDRDVVILNEDKNYIQSDDLRYSEIRSYIRIVKDPYPNNRIEKKPVDIPSEYAIIKYPTCAILQFGQPVPIPEARIDEGDIGRDIIPFVDFEDIDQSDLLRKRPLEDFDYDSDEVAAENFVAFIEDLPEVDEFEMEDAAKKTFADFSELLYQYGMQFSEKVANYMQKKKTRIQDYFLKLAAIQAASNKKSLITVDDVKKAFIDYFEMLTLEFDLIEKFVILDLDKAWRGAKSEDRLCLEWLQERGAISFDESNITIAEYQEKICECCKLQPGGARNRYNRHKANRWIDSKQTGQHGSKVWLLFKSTIRRITSKEFVTTAYKTYSELVSKYSGYHPYHPYHPEDGNITEEKCKCVCGAVFATSEELRRHQANCDKFQIKQSAEVRKI